jgi:hypothetical protein
MPTHYYPHMKQTNKQTLATLATGHFSLLLVCYLSIYVVIDAPEYFTNLMKSAGRI